MKNLILQEIRQLKEKNNVKSVATRSHSRDDTLSEKSSVSGKSSKTQASSIIRSGLDLFKGMKFCFPLVDIDLSPKRVEIITKSIRAEQGVVLAYCDQPIEEPIDYLLVSPSAKIDALVNKISRKLKFGKIVDFNFILNSLREGVLLAA